VVHALNQMRDSMSLNGVQLTVARAIEELGAQADEAIAAGRLQFAERFSDVECRRVYTARN
jgi:hypothetical protein